MSLTIEEVSLLLELLQEKYGFGYSEYPKIARLQVKLSIMLDMLEARRRVSESLESSPRTQP